MANKFLDEIGLAQVLSELKSNFDSKANVSHTHTASDITELPTGEGGTDRFRITKKINGNDLETLIGDGALDFNFDIPEESEEYELALEAHQNGKSVEIVVSCVEDVEDEDSEEMMCLEIPLNFIMGDGSFFGSIVTDTFGTFFVTYTSSCLSLTVASSDEDDEGGSSNSVSWNDLTDRPFYSEITEGIDDIILPTDKTGLPKVDVDLSEMMGAPTGSIVVSYYKVPNVDCDINDLIGGIVSFDFGDGVETQTIQYNNADIRNGLFPTDGGYYYDANVGFPPFCFVEDKSEMTEPTTFPENGVYLLYANVMGMVISCDSITKQGGETIHKLDAKYLPDDISSGLGGNAPTVTVGTVETLDSDEEAYVEEDESSTASNVVLNFGIPKGADGEDGEGGGTEKYIVEVSPTPQQFVTAISGTPATIELDSGTASEIEDAFADDKDVEIYVSVPIVSDVKIPMFTSDRGSVSYMADLTQSGTETLYNFAVSINSNDGVDSLTFYITSLEEGSGGSSESDIFRVDGTLNLITLTATVEKTFTEISTALAADKDVRLRLANGTGYNFGNLVSADANGIIFNSNIVMGNVLMSFNITVASNNTVSIQIVQVQA